MGSLVGSILFSLILFIYCSAVPCTYSNGNSLYDLSSLTVAAGSAYYTTIHDSTNYTFNICDEITGSMIGTASNLCADGTAMCQGEAGAYYSVGMISNISFYQSNGGPDGGVGILYGSGKNCPAARRNREVRLDVLCAPSVTGLEILNYTQVVACSYLFYLQSSAACPSGATGDTVTTSDLTTAITGTVTTTEDATSTTDATTGTTTSTVTTSDSTSDAASTTSTTTTSVSSTSSSTSSISSSTSTTASSTSTTASSTTKEPTTSTTGHNSSDEPIHKTPMGKAMIAVIVGLSVFVIIVSVFLVREFYRRRRAQDDHQLERLRLTGSTYEDTKKRYLK